MTTPHEVIALVRERQKIREDLLKRKPAAIIWANKIGLKHWHEAQWGCSDTCLNGIHFTPDIDHEEGKSKKAYKIQASYYAERPDPAEAARRKSRAVRTSVARRKRLRDLEAEQSE